MIDKGCILSVIFGFVLLLIVVFCEAISDALGINVFWAFVLLLLSFVLLVYSFIAVIEKKERKDSEKQGRIKRMYPRAYDKFLKEHHSMKEFVLQKAILSREDSIWDTEESELIKEEIKNRELHEQFQKIRNSCPNGYRIYIQKHPQWTTDDIRNNREIISMYEKYAPTMSAYFLWENEQRNFSNKCTEIIKNACLSLGVCMCDVEYERISELGESATYKFVVCQIFSSAISLVLDEEQQLDLFPGISQSTKRFKESGLLTLGASSYSIIRDFLKSLGNPDDILVYLNPKSAFLDEGLHWSYLFQIITENEGWKVCDILAAKTIGIGINEDECLVKFKGKYVVIIDTVTTKECLKAISKRIREIYPENAPHICFISLCKYYNREETESLVARKIAQIKKETAEKQRTREQLTSAVSSWQLLDGGLPYCYLFNYYPEESNVDADDIVWGVRRFIWDFKDTNESNSLLGHEYAIEIAYLVVKRRVESTFPCECLKNLTFVCIPASSQDRNNARYEKFSQRLCNALGMVNAFPYIKVIKEREPRHICGSSFSLEGYHFDEDFFRNKNVLLFDDIITRGDSMRAFKGKLEQLGATVIAGMSLGLTRHKKLNDDGLLISMDIPGYC